MISDLSLTVTVFFKIHATLKGRLSLQAFSWFDGSSSDVSHAQASLFSASGSYLCPS
jgi:hypothetical protein